VVVPGLKDVVQGSTFATSSRPRVSARSSFSCFPDEPRKMRGLSISSSRQQMRSRDVLRGKSAWRGAEGPSWLLTARR